MPQKGKLPPGMKAKIVENYLAGRAGSSEITQKYSIHKSTLDDWVRLYQSQGLLGVSPKMFCFGSKGSVIVKIGDRTHLPFF